MDKRGEDTARFSKAFAGIFNTRLHCFGVPCLCLLARVVACLFALLALANHFFPLVSFLLLYAHNTTSLNLAADILGGLDTTTIQTKLFAGCAGCAGSRPALDFVGAGSGCFSWSLPAVKYEQTQRRFGGLRSKWGVKDQGREQGAFIFNRNNMTHHQIFIFYYVVLIINGYLRTTYI